MEKQARMKQAEELRGRKSSESSSDRWKIVAQCDRGRKKAARCAGRSAGPLLG